MAITFAVSMLAILMVVGIAIDALRVFYAREALQSAMDSAMTAAAAEALKETIASVPDPAATEKVAKDFFAANFKISADLVLPTYSFDAKYVDDATHENSVVGTLDADIVLAFPSFLGWRTPTIPVHLKSVASRPRPAPLEMALVMDVTLSMDDMVDGTRRTDTTTQRSKLMELKDASKDLVEYVMQSDYARIGIVPFTNFVNIGTSYNGQAWLELAPSKVITGDTDCTETKTNCTTDKNATCKNTDTQLTYTCEVTTCDTVRTCTGTRTVEFAGCVPPRGTTENQAFTPSNTISDPTKPQYYGPLGGCVIPQITDLIDKKYNDNKGAESVKAKIDSLAAVTNGNQGTTFIPIGLIWGWNMLDAEQPLNTGSAHTDNRQPKKSLVLITDGDNSIFPSGKGGYVSADIGGASQGKADTLTAAICDNIRTTSNVEVFTVAISIPSASTRQMLENCAKRPENFFNVTTAAQLKTAFEKIGKSLSYNSLTQ